MSEFLILGWFICSLIVSGMLLVNSEDIEKDFMSVVLLNLIAWPLFLGGILMEKLR